MTTMTRRRQFDWTLPPEIEARLGDQSYGRQRAIFEAGHLLVVLHAPPVAGALERETLVFLRRPSGELLVNGRPGGEHALRGLLADYRERWEACDAEYDTAESASELFRLQEKLAPQKRASTNLAHALQAARDCAKGDKLLINMRDESYELSRAFELLLSDAKLKLDYRMARNAEAHVEKVDELAAAQHRLNVLAALTFPVMALATVLGMNITHGLENRSPLWFVAVLAAGIALGSFVKGWVARSRPDARQRAIERGDAAEPRSP
jgi:hypothetical protein